VSFFQQIELTTSPFSSLHFLLVLSSPHTYTHTPFCFFLYCSLLHFPHCCCCWSSLAAAASSCEPCFLQAVAFRSFCVRRSGARSGFRVHRSRALYVSALPKQTHTKR
jgi:predicted amidophosphoribosyltransferase